MQLAKVDNLRRRFGAKTFACSLLRFSFCTRGFLHLLFTFRLSTMANVKQLCAQITQAEADQDYHKLLDTTNQRKYSLNPINPVLI